MANNLTKKDIVLDIYETTKFPQKQVRDTVQMTLDVIAKALASGQNVELRNFGVFELQVRKSRIGRNPNKPEVDVMIPERTVVKFKAGKELKAELKEMDLKKGEAPKPAAGATAVPDAIKSPEPSVIKPPEPSA